MPLLLFALWLLLCGEISVQIVLFGLLLTGIFTLFLYKILGHTVSRDLHLLRAIPWSLLYLGNLLREIVLCSLQVAAVTLHPAQAADPVFVEFHSGLTSEALNVLLANSITLTPGTITVFQEHDHFVIHALRAQYAEGIDDSSFLHLLRRFPP